MNITDFLTWEMLGTFAGAVVAVALLTQFLKDTFKKLPTQWLSYVISVVLLALATAATQGVATWDIWALIPFNAAVVSLTANGGYAAIERLKNGKQ